LNEDANPVRQTLRQHVAEAEVDLAVGMETLQASRAKLAIDYNLTRARRAVAIETRCCEITDLIGPYGSILIEARAFEAAAQLGFDIAEAARRLRAGGEVTVAISDRRRARSGAMQMSSVFARVEKQTFPDGVLLRGHEPLSFAGLPEQNPISLPQQMFDPLVLLKSWPGLFSGDQLDVGTRVLIEETPDPAGLEVLDVGCGYGPLTMAAALRGGRVTFADVDCRALRITSENLEAFGLTGTPVLTTDLSELGEAKYDLVLSNPPTHAGSQVLRMLFERMVSALKPDGRMLIVVREHLNYEKWLREMSVLTLGATRGGYKILQCTAGPRR
jgi:16S rRNA G1207 methylase RsmC